MGEGQRENPKQALCTVSTEPDTELSPVTCQIMTEAEIKKSLTLHRLNYSGTPINTF